MRNSLLLVLLFLSISVFAQPAGFSKVTDINGFRTALAKANAQIQNIASDFKQKKTLSLLADEVNATGKFYYKKEDKVRIEYVSPYKYLLIMNGTKMLVEDEEKSTTINAGNSKMMQSVNNVITDCMQGTVFSNTDFDVNIYKSNGQYMLALMPVNVSMKRMFRQIDVYLDAETYDVEKLVMTEKGGDNTVMDFYNTRHNITMNEVLFKVK